MEQLLQQAGTERTVDVFSVALKQTQACGLKTPTLVRGKEGGLSKKEGFVFLLMYAIYFVYIYLR